jgi:hypothetical protein
VPFAIEAPAGVTDNEVNSGAVTVNVAVPLMPPELAVILALPCTIPVAKPPLLTVAVAFDEEVQAAVLLRFWVVPLV